MHPNEDGTGAQGMSVIRDLVADKKYSVRVLTRDAASARAQALLEIGDVSLLEGSFADEDVLREGFCGCDGAFVNIDGFNTGEKTETHWAIRSYEIAIEGGFCGPQEQRGLQDRRTVDVHGRGVLQATSVPPPVHSK